MERDFLGLNSKESLLLAEDEVKEIGFTKSSGFQWPYSNKGSSAVPRLMNFDFGLGDEAKKTAYDSMVSPDFMHISTPDAVRLQKSFIHNKQRVGNHFPLTPSSSSSSSVQRDVHRVHRPYDRKMYPVLNQSVSVSMTNPYSFTKNHFATTGQNSPVTTAVEPQLFGGIPVTSLHSFLPTLGPFGGSTEPWKSVRGQRDSGSPAQLTIFYAGTVNVYNDITPEKAQAIMLLAGNGSSTASDVAHPKVQVQAPFPKPVQFETVPVNQLINTQPSCGIPSPLSVSSHTGVQSRGGSTSTDELVVCKATGSLTTSISKVEPPKLANTLGSVSAYGMMPSVPQARKASLARFLEKRKDRVMTAAPYDLNKNSLRCTPLESNA